MKYKTLCRGMLAIVLSAALVSNGNALCTGMQGKTIIKAESSNDTSKDTSYLTISSARELKEFAQKVNNGNSYQGKVVKLAKNIEFDGVTVNNFTPIGNLSYKFAGTFDGAGHTIKGINVTKYGAAFMGLFGYIADNGIVKNLTMEACEFEGGSYVGSIAGSNDGTIYNCYNKGGNILGTGYSGGIAGQNSGIIKNCISNGNVNMKDAVYSASGCGGIAGNSYGSKIYNSANLGNVSFSGDNSYSSAYIGGVVGTVIEGSEIQNCYNVGKIKDSTASQKMGAIAGWVSDKSIVANSYTSEEAYGVNFATMNGVEKNIKALPEADMKTDSFLEQLNRNRGDNEDWLKWEFRSDSEYPVLIKLVDLSDCQMQWDKTAYTYTGKVIKPSVTIINKGVKLKKGNDYTISYQNNKNVGTATMRIQGKNAYTGTITTTYVIHKGIQQIRYAKSYKKAYKAKPFAVYAKRVVGNGKVTYKSSNKKVATVSNKGIVTPKNTGKAIITVTAAETSNYHKKSVKIIVQVEKNKK